MGIQQDNVRAELVDDGAVLHVRNVRYKWGTDFGRALHCDVECLPWLTNALRRHLEDNACTEKAFSRDRLQVDFSGPDYHPYVCITNRRDDDAPHGGVATVSMLPPIGHALLAQLQLLADHTPTPWEHEPDLRDLFYRCECPACGEDAHWSGGVEKEGSELGLLMQCAACPNRFLWVSGALQEGFRLQPPVFSPGRGAP